MPSPVIDTSEDHKGSWKLCTAFGISVYIHWSFILLIVWLLRDAENQATDVVVNALTFTAAVFGCVILHEFGHALTAKIFKIKTREITILPILGFARLERTPDDPSQEFWIASAGPAVNLAIAALLAMILRWVLGMEPLPKSFSDATFLQRLLFMNIALTAINVIPAFPMDGGRVLRAILGMRLDYVLATRIAAWLGQGCAGLLTAYALIDLVQGIGIFHNLNLIAVSVFVYFGADEEVKQAPLRKAFKGIFIKDVMHRKVCTVSPEDYLDEIVEILADENPVDLAVLNGQRVVGVLTRDRLIGGLTEVDRRVQVKELMYKDVPLLEENYPLEVAFQRNRESESPSFPILRDNKLVGILMLQEIAQSIIPSSNNESMPSP